MRADPDAGQRPFGLRCVSTAFPRPLKALLTRRTPNQFRPNQSASTTSAHEYDFERDKLAVHGIEFEEAVDCFFNDFMVRRNKSYTDRFQLIGRTSGGRQLLIIFQLKAGNVVRIITGWQV